MRVSFISVLSNLELRTETNHIEYAGIELVKTGANIRGFQDRQFMNAIGNSTFRGFMNSPCLYLNEDLAPERNKLDQINDGMTRVRGVVEYVLFSLWLVKDNAVNSELIVSRFGDEEDDQILENKATRMLSASDGEYASTRFSPEELRDSQQWFSLIGETAFGSGDEHRETPGKAAPFFHYINSEKLSPYHQSNRFQRMIRFITLARSESFLFAKISFYISALEAALSTSSSEIHMQVGDRVSGILGTGSDERQRIHKIISLAYAFRSTYIHGSMYSEENIEKELDPSASVEKLAVEMDHILRMLARRFLTDLNHVPTMPEEKFVVWTDELPR